MNELNTIKFLINRIETQVDIIGKKNNIEKEAHRLADEDERNGKKHTFWSRKTQLGYDEVGLASKQDIKDTLKLIRKISLELEKSL